MDSVKTRIDEIQKEIDAAWSGLRTQAHMLAVLAGKLTEGDLPLIAPSLRQGFLDAEKNASQLRVQKGQRDELRRRLSEGQQRVSSLQKERGQSAKKLKELETLIGAVAFAQAGLDDCNAEVREALKPFIDESEKLMTASRARFIAGFIGRIRLSFYQKRQNTVFASCYSTLKEKNLLDSLTGERAGDLVASHRAIEDSIGILEKDIEARKHRLSASQLEMEDDGGLDERLKEAETLANESGVNYGLYLFENGFKWIGPDTPESFLDIIQEMLTLQKAIEDSTHQIELEKEWAAIADFQSMIDFNNRKIEGLRAEIDRLRAEISSIEDDNRALKRKIAKVEERTK